jgi:putative exporter of polyketide antibiotics
MNDLTAFISEHWEVTVAAVLAAVCGGLVLRYRSHRQTGSSSFSDQRGAEAGGDVVGRDKVTRIDD